MEISAENKRKLDAVCQSIANLYKKQLIADDAVASRKLLKSVDNWSTNGFEGDKFELYFNLESYWKYSPEDIYKGIGQVKKANGKFAPPPKKMVDSIRQWIADKHLNLNEYAVATNITKFGWRNQPRKNYETFRNGFDFRTAENELRALITDILREELDNEISKIISNI